LQPGRSRRHHQPDSAFGAIANLAPFYEAMKKVARLNAWAASCAFVSAAAQAAALYLSTH
jgi:hypothetical protein